MNRLDAVRDVVIELESAREQHRPLAYESYAVIQEEVDEAWDEIKVKRPDLAKVRHELFNTRPYHNYENWSDGWRVSIYARVGEYEATEKPILVIEREDLDDAVRDTIKALTEKALQEKAAGQ